MPQIVDPRETRRILQAFGIRAHKKLGQNFLIDTQVLDEIVAAGEITPTDTVLEIGPGIGTLTQALAETGAHVVAVELDARLIDVLAKTLAAYDNVRILHGDILKVDISREIPTPGFKVIANLPYYITTPVLMYLLESRFAIERIVVMVQKEVAQRLTAAPGGKDYGALSVAAQYYAQVDWVLDVPARAFLPVPAVDSAVVRCTVRHAPPVQVRDEQRFFRIVKAGFAQRRKTFQNALKATGLESDAVRDLLDQAGIDGSRRGETLSLQEFADVANAWEKTK